MSTPQNLIIVSMQEIGNPGDDGYTIEVVSERSAPEGPTRHRLLAELTKTEALDQTREEAIAHLEECAQRYALSGGSSRKAPPSVERVGIKKSGAAVPVTLTIAAFLGRRDEPGGWVPSFRCPESGRQQAGDIQPLHRELSQVDTVRCWDPDCRLKAHELNTTRGRVVVS